MMFLLWLKLCLWFAFGMKSSCLMMPLIWFAQTTSLIEDFIGVCLQATLAYSYFIEGKSKQIHTEGIWNLLVWWCFWNLRFLCRRQRHSMKSSCLRHIKSYRRQIKFIAWFEIKDFIAFYYAEGILKQCIVWSNSLPSAFLYTLPSAASRRCNYLNHRRLNTYTYMRLTAQERCPQV